MHCCAKGLALQCLSFDDEAMYILFRSSVVDVSCVCSQHFFPYSQPSSVNCFGRQFLPSGGLHARARTAQCQLGQTTTVSLSAVSLCPWSQDCHRCYLVSQATPFAEREEGSGHAATIELSPRQKLSCTLRRSHLLSWSSTVFNWCVW